MIQRSKSHGFTLVELLLAMSFLAILLVAIATLTIQVTNIYTRGVTLTAVNQVGQTVVKELRTTLNQSQGNNVSVVSLGDKDQTGGRLCAGHDSYAWNYGPAIVGSNTDYGEANLISADSNANPRDVRFVKFLDPSGSACIANEDGQYPSLTDYTDTARELLMHKDRNIALRNLQFLKKTLGSQVIYSVDMTIATNDGGDFIKTGADAGRCAPSRSVEGSGDDSFCAVNTFSFTARSGSM